MKSRELMRRFRQAGWVLDRVHGGHHIFKKGSRTFAVPYHGSRDLSSGLVRAALKLIEEEEDGDGDD